LCPQSKFLSNALIVFEKFAILHLDDVISTTGVLGRITGAVLSFTRNSKPMLIGFCVSFTLRFL